MNWGKAMEELIGSLIGQIAPERALDVACGSGSSLELLIKSTPRHMQFVGIDADRSLLLGANANLPSGQVKLLQMMAEAMGFAGDSFDLVCVFASLHHLNEPESVISEMLRVLQPGGSFLLAEMYNDAMVEPRLTAVQIHHWAAEVDAFRGVFHHKTFARQAITRLVEQLNLERVAYHDYLEIDNEPFDVNVLSRVNAYIDRYLTYIDMSTDGQNSEIGKALIQQGSELKIKLGKTGFLSEPVVVAVGQKPVK